MKELSPQARHFLSLQDEGPDLQTYSVGGLLLPQGYSELKLYNNLYTQTRFFNSDWSRQSENPETRSTFFTSTFSSVNGISDRLNLGFDVNFRSVNRSPAVRGPLDVFTFGSTDTSRTAISTLGPKIRLNPFKNKDFTFQGTIWIPIAADLEGRNNEHPFLDWNRYQVWLSLFYVKTLSPGKWTLFAATEFVPRIDRRFNPDSNDLIIFNKAILSYFPNRELTFYSSLEISPNVQFGENAFFGMYVNGGLGVKYLIKQMLSIDVLYSNFVTGINAGAGQTFNLGISFFTGR